VLSRSNERYHVCILDRCLNDVQNDEFYLMDKFRKDMPFITITARHDSEKGFECAKHGAKVVLSKDRPDFIEKLLCYTNLLSIKSIVCPSCHESPAPLLCRMIDSLFWRKPYHVNSIAIALKMSDRSLRDAWIKYVGINPKYSICIYHLYSKAFEYVERIGCRKGKINIQQCIKETFNEKKAFSNHERFPNYYTRKRTIIENFIRSPSG
jgi:hypothetical protein